MELSILFDIPFDILDDAVYECLPGYAPGWVDFTREQLTAVRVVYRLRQDQLGDLGEIQLRKRSEEKSEMQIIDPRRLPSRDPTLEELAAIAAIPGRKERLRAHTALSKKIWAESDELLHPVTEYQRRREHLRKVIQVMFSRMARERHELKEMAEYAHKEAMEQQIAAHIRDRREKVKQLSIEAYTIQAISKNLGVSESTVKRDRKWLRDRSQL